MGDHTLFFYGTLMAPQILHRVIHGRPDPEPWQKDLVSFKPAVLHGYRRHRVRGADYPGIIPDTNVNAYAYVDVDDNSNGGNATNKGRNTNTNTDKNSTENTMPTSTTTTTDTTTPAEKQRQQQQHYVLGSLVSGLTDGDIYRLDLFEGSDYVRTPVKARVLRETLSAGGRQESFIAKKNPGGHLKDVLDAAGAEFADEGEEVDAVTYVWVGGGEGLEGVEWDFESFKREKMAWWVGADESEW